MAGRLKNAAQQLRTLDRHILEKCWIILNGFFLPITITKLFSGLIQMLPMFLRKAIAALLFVPVIGGIILRCFYIPHILAGILIAASTLRIVRNIRRKEFRTKELILLLISIAICVLNLYAFEEVFTAAMSV